MWRKKLKSIKGYSRSIIFNPLIPIHYIFKNDNELKIYDFSLFPTLKITRDKCINNDELSIEINWLLGGIEYSRIKEDSPSNIDKYIDE